MCFPPLADEDEHARALEDQWMEGLTGQNEVAVETCELLPSTALLKSTINLTASRS